MMFTAALQILGLLDFYYANRYMQNKGYTTLEASANPIRSSNQWDWQGMFPSLFSKGLKLLYDTVSWSERVEFKNAREFWSPIINKRSKFERRLQQDAGLAQYFSTRKELMEFAESNETHV